MDVYPNPLVIQKRKLDKERADLDEFLSCDAARFVGPEAMKLLIRQQDIMQQLSDVYDRRLALHEASG